MDDAIQQFILEFKMLNNVTLDRTCLREWKNGTFLLDLDDWDQSRLILPKTLADKIAVLMLFDSKLETFPENIEALVNLKDLHLTNSNIHTIPESIEKLKNLEVMEMYGNQLTQLPASIGTLTKLRQLYFEDNNLMTLPDTIANLGNLKWLYIQNNKLDPLPAQTEKVLEKLGQYGCWIRQ